MDFEFDKEQMTENRSEKMEQEPRTTNLVDTTDCLEAVSVIRCWKNLIFIIILLCLLLLQLAFMLVNWKVVKADQSDSGAAVSEMLTSIDEKTITAEEKIKQAATAVAGDANKVLPASSMMAETSEESKESTSPRPKLWLKPKVKHVKALVRFLDVVLIPASILYCLTMLFAMKVSLIGRLGGINHIARAFFLSLLFVVLLMPWQVLFAPVFAGALFTPNELINACAAEKNTLASVAFYLRFPGYWLLVLLLLLAAQFRSIRWARATFRRLEVV